MKILIITLAILVALPLAALADETTIVSAASEAAEGLDLNVVAELFKEAETLEDFERDLNDPEIGVNNLDLNDDGEVDFIRVLDEFDGDTHIIVLQVLLGDDEFQDVAYIEVERTGDDYNLQVHGHASFYGPNYYIVPHAHVHTWPCVVWIYGPRYHPYHSGWYWGHYPHWYRPYRHVHVDVYRTRTVHYHQRASFRVVNTSQVRTVNKVKYTPKASTQVKKRTVSTTTRSTTVKRSSTSGRTTVNKSSRTTTRRDTKVNSRSGQSTTKRKATTTNKRSSEQKKATKKKSTTERKSSTTKRKSTTTKKRTTKKKRRP